MLSLAGCGQGNAQPAAPSQQIELIEPVNAQQSYELAAKRSIYGSTVYAATVVPLIEEYSTETGFVFGSYGAFLGEEVQKGQVLITSDTTSMNEEIKNKKEEIASMEEEYQKYVSKQLPELEKQREDEEHFKREVEKNEGEKPDEFLPPETPGGDPIPNPDYAHWEMQIDYNEGCYRIAKHAADTIELEMSQKKEIYDLDHKHQQYLLKKLQSNLTKASINARISGTVVAVADFNPGDYVRSDTPVVAVADMSVKYLKCEYVSNNTVKKAKDIYALINGKRVELEYQYMSPEEYTELSASGKVYSTFKILGEDLDVNVGDYAVITVVSDLREDVISVSKSAIHKDELGQFVYVLHGDDSVRTSVQLGYSDGNFTEILSGLAEGDKVMSSSAQQVGDATAVVKRGSFSSKYSEKAELTYSSSIRQKNPIKYGTVYFGECLVKMYQHVNKGDVIATIRVEPDKMSITRSETQLARIKERFADFKEENKEHTSEEYYVETVKSYEKQIKDIEDQIADKKRDAAVTQIKAEKTGVIVYDEKNWGWMGDFSKEQIISPDAFLLMIADESSCCMLVDDSNQVLQYGNQVKVTYTDAEQNKKTIDCMVGCMSKIGVSNNLRGDQTKVLLPNDSIEDIMQGMFAGEWWVAKRYTVDADLRVMNDVLLVPREAVFDIAGKTYVYVKGEDGEVKAQGFISGGFNTNYYFVVQGLSEGMEVCLK